MLSPFSFQSKPHTSKLSHAASGNGVPNLTMGCLHALVRKHILVAALAAGLLRSVIVSCAHIFAPDGGIEPPINV
jgi:hypothetical protein